MPRKTINPKNLFNSTQYGFSQLAISEPGKLVFISGQTAWDENEEIVGAGDLEAQTQKTLENLKLAVESAGGTLEHIMMLRIYIVNFQSEDAPIISQALNNFFGTDNPPASTWINVQGLANEKFMIEIEAQAVV